MCFNRIVSYKCLNKDGEFKCCSKSVWASHISLTCNWGCKKWSLAVGTLWICGVPEAMGSRCGRASDFSIFSFSIKHPQCSCWWAFCWFCAPGADSPCSPSVNPVGRPPTTHPTAWEDARPVAVVHSLKSLKP